MSNRQGRHGISGGEAWEKLLEGNQRRLGFRLHSTTKTLRDVLPERNTSGRQVKLQVPRSVSRRIDSQQRWQKFHLRHVAACAARISDFNPNTPGRSFEWRGNRRGNG